MTTPPVGPILTLEPLINAVQDGVLAAGWQLSGLQKTTSHQFEGRWEGESTRSAYVFFHDPDGPEHVSIDVYLDETSRGLIGNIALVVDLLELEHLGEVQRTLGLLGTLSRDALPEGPRAPVSLRFRLADGGEEPGRAESQVRFKVRFSRKTIAAGHMVVSELVLATVRSFQVLLNTDALQAFGPSEP